MALTAPSYSGPRMDGLPFAPAAVEDDSAAFAGVGKPLGALPAVVADAAREQRAVCDRAAVKAATNRARTAMLSGMEDIANGDGVNAAARATDLVEKIRKEAGPAVTAVPELAGMYDYAANAMADTYTLLARRREVRGRQEADRAAVREEQDILLSETKAIWQANGAASSGPDGEVLIDTDGTVLPPVNPWQETAKRALRAVQNEAVFIKPGATQKQIDSALNTAAAKVYMTAVNALMPDNPASALEYLNRPEVKSVMLKKDWNAAVKLANGQVIALDGEALAEELAENVESGEIGIDEVERIAGERFPDGGAGSTANAKGRKIAMSKAKSILDAKAAAAKAAAVERENVLVDKIRSADFKFANLPAEEQRMMLLDDDMYQAFTRMEKFKEDNPSVGPDYGWYYSMKENEQKSPGYIANWINSPSVDPDGNIGAIKKKLAGNDTMIKEILNLSLGGLSGGGGGDGSVGGGGGGFTVKTLNPVDFWKSSTPPGTFDKDEESFRQNGFAGLYRSTLNDEEQNVLKRKATFAEQEDIARRLHRQIDEGLIDAMLPYYEQVDQARAISATAAAVEKRVVDVAALPFTERRHNHGEAAASLSPVVGAAKAVFGILDPRDTRQLPPEVLEVKPVEVLRAYSPGRIGEREYAAGDLFAYDRKGSLRLFDPEGGQKGGRFTEAPGGGTPDALAASQEEALAEAERAEEARREMNVLRNRRAELVENYNNTHGERIAREDAARAAGELIPRTNADYMVEQYHKRRLREIDEEIQALGSESK